MKDKSNLYLLKSIFNIDIISKFLIIFLFGINQLKSQKIYKCINAYEYNYLYKFSKDIDYSNIYIELLEDTVSICYFSPRPASGSSNFEFSNYFLSENNQNLNRYIFKNLSVLENIGRITWTLGCPQDHLVFFDNDNNLILKTKIKLMDLEKEVILKFLLMDSVKENTEKLSKTIKWFRNYNITANFKDCGKTY